MSHPKCFDSDSIDFLIASPKTASCCEAARAQPPSPAHPAHDAYTRLLHRTVPDPDVLSNEAEPVVNKSDGVLVLDDSTLDTFDAETIEPVHRHWSGKHKAMVWGIHVISLVWADGDRIMPLDYRISNKPNDARTKNDHFRDMVQMAKQRGFHPHAVLFESWDSGLENLKLIRDCGGMFLTQLKVNRKVDLDRQGDRAVAQTSLASEGTVVPLEGFGSVTVFKVVSRDGEIESWATNDLAMDELGRLVLAERCWAVEEDHRALTQCCNVEKCQAWSARTQRTQIGMAIRAFVRLSWHFYTTGISWYEAKAQIVREAVRAYRAFPLYRLTPTA